MSSRRDLVSGQQNMRVTKTSLSHKLSWYRIVTRFLSHVCEISCSTMSVIPCFVSKAESSESSSTLAVRNMKMAQFSIALAEKSGPATGSSLGSGFPDCSGDEFDSQEIAGIITGPGELARLSIILLQDVITFE